MRHLTLNRQEIKAVSKHEVGSLDYLLDKYGDLLTDELGTIRSFQAELPVKPQDLAKFFKSRTIPYALQSYTEEVFCRLQAHSILMKRSKCFFMRDSVDYLGHMVDAEGIRGTPEKIAAIERAPMLKNVQQLRSFLRLLNFLPNLATVVQPLNDLLQKDRK